MEEVNLLIGLGVESEVIIYVLLVGLLATAFEKMVHKAFKMEDRWRELVGVGLAVLLGVVFGLLPQLDFSLLESALYGLIAGLIPVAKELVKRFSNKNKGDATK